MLFGDGAGAVVLRQQRRRHRPAGIRAGLQRRGRRPARRWRRPATRAAPAPARTSRWTGPQVYKFATTVSVESAARVLDAIGLSVADVDVFVPAPGQPADHRACRAAAGHPGREGVLERRPLRQHVGGIDSHLPGRGYRSGRIRPRRHRADGRIRRRPLVGLVRDGMVNPSQGARMSKVAFCFPGQGSQRVGMGRDLVAQFPEAAAVFDEASNELDFDLRRVCFEGPIEELSETEVTQPALVATSLAALRAIEERLGTQARRRRRPQRRRVRGASRPRTASVSASSPGSCASAAWPWRHRRRAARWRPCSAWPTRRSSGSAPRPATCGRPTTTAPGSSSSPAARRASPASATKARDLGGKVVRLRVSGAFHSPLVEDAGASPRAGAARRPLSASCSTSLHVHRVEPARDRRPRARPAGRADAPRRCASPSRCRRSSPTACARSSRSARAACWPGWSSGSTESVTALSVGHAR